MRYTRSMLAPVIVNADDFGHSAGVNEAIAAGFAAGAISSTTFMANMPAAAEAADLARARGFGQRIGIHLNLTEGEPLSEPIRREPAFCDADGRYRPTLRRAALDLTPSQARAVETELRAQIARTRDLGIAPTHFDSHHHVHNIWPVGSIVVALARENRVPVRIARNWGPGLGPVKTAFKLAFNARLSLLGLRATEFQCLPDDLLAMGGAPAGSTDLVCHPRLLPTGEVTDTMLGGLTLLSVLERFFPGRPRTGYGRRGA